MRQDEAHERIVIAKRRLGEFNAQVAAHTHPRCHYSDHLRAGIALGLFPDASGCGPVPVTGAGSSRAGGCCVMRMAWRWHN